MQPKRRLFLEALENRLALAIDIKFNYSLDDNDFFADDARKKALDAAANAIEERLTDTLAALPGSSGDNNWTAGFIHPSFTATAENDGLMTRMPPEAGDTHMEVRANFEVPADTLIVFVGGRTFVGGQDGYASTGQRIRSVSDPEGVAWKKLIEGRGEDGAVDGTNKDVGPWGGSIGFDRTTNWYFGLDGNVPAGQTNFLTVAQHEIGHLLGFNDGVPSWDRVVTGGNFTGTAAVAAFGGPVPASGGHWGNDVQSDGRQATMVAIGNGTGRGFTTLDFAALDDIGWELRPPPTTPPGVPATTPVTVSVTELIQFNSPDDGIDDDGDYYIRVFINGVEHRDETEHSPDGDDEAISPDGWSFTQPVPSSLSSVPVRIEIFDSDDTLNFIDNQMDISPANGHLGIDLTVTLADGRWTGGPSFPIFYPDNIAKGNGGGVSGGSIQIKFETLVTGSVSRGLTVGGDGVLTVQGDQFVPNLDDDLTLDRTASGGLKVTLNGHVREYASGAITGIVVNTGQGSNVVRMLSSPGVPITINGAGLDRLTLGSGLPDPTFTQDGSGLPGWGTVHVGSQLIHHKSLEIVEGVEPNVSGVVLSSATIDENGVATVTGTFTDAGSHSTHSVSLNWGDGSSDPPLSLPLGSRSFTLTHRYLDDNPSGSTADNYNISATVTDNENRSDNAGATITVRNVAPQLQNVTSTAQIDENGSVTLSGQIIDPGTQDTFTLRVDWGEGAAQIFSYPAGTTQFSVTHPYRDDNPTGTPQDVYSIGLLLTDDDSNQATATTSTLVKNVAPVFTGLGTSSTSSGPAQEGQPMTISGSFSDVGTLDTHSVTVDWGDGIAQAAQVTEGGGSGSFLGQHAYQSGGIYPVVVTLRDDDTGEVVRIKTVFVTGVGVHEVGGYTSLQVVGTVGSDHVSINQQGNGQIKVHASFLADGKRTLPLAGLETIQVVLLAGNDHASVSGNVGLTAVLDGGEGDDHFNGSNASSVVIGGGGSDHLNGGNSRDLIIGGLGADRLVANSGDDILIAGTTSYDSGLDDDKLASDLALLKLLQEWNSTRSYAERTANLRSGSGLLLAGTGLSLKKGVTVFGDASLDVLTGSAGSDWFFTDVGDNPNDRKNGEDVD